MAFLLVAQIVQMADHISKQQDFSNGKEIVLLIKGLLNIDAVQAVTNWLRWFLNVKGLIPLRNGLLWLPTPAFILGIVAFAAWLGGKKPAFYAAVFFTFVAMTGWWNQSVITLYTVISAVIISMLIGIPLGIVAARNETWAKRILLVCDTAQTFPSFIYLIRAIMLFGVNDVAVVFSIVIFAIVPLTRYTIESLRTVPVEITEAVDMAGATRHQELISVQLTLALLTMVVGYDQAIMFAFLW
jgi:glycine betaine/proline transport system permease protein